MQHVELFGIVKRKDSEGRKEMGGQCVVAGFLQNSCHSVQEDRNPQRDCVCVCVKKQLLTL